MKNFNKNLFFLGIFITAFVFINSVQAASIDDALKDLGQATGESITTQEQAGEVCDSEKYFTVCAEIGKKYSLYSQAEVKQVDSLVSEIKGQIESELKRCQTTECLIEVAQKLSQKVSAKNPKLAEQAELTSKFVQKKQAIIEAAKELGVNYQQCRELDPDTASVELLRGCAKLAKDSRVKDNIPKEAVAQAEMGEKALELRQALKSGEVQCGNGTLESCGNFCLNPSAEAQAQGGSAIPSICRDIAKKFFGPEGEKELENSYNQVGQVRSSYLRKAESLTFQTIDGQTITNPEEIGRYMEEQGRQGNVEAVEKGMDFMVNNSFAQPEEKEFALKMVRQAKGRGGLPDFDACSRDPQSCSDFIPQELKGEFEAQMQVKEIISQETGFDPSQCGSGDSSVGQKCFEGAKKALEKLQSLESQNPNAQKIINDLRQRVNRQEEFHGKQEELQQVFQQQGGPGGCKSEEECRSFCSDAANGQECFSFGSQQGLSGFQGEEGQQRFEQFNQKIQEARQNQPTNFNFPGRGPFPGFQPPGQGGTPPGQIEGFPGRDFQKDGSDFQKDGANFQKDRQDFQKDGQGFQKDGGNFQKEGQGFTGGDQQRNQSGQQNQQNQPGQFNQQNSNQQNQLRQQGQPDQFNQQNFNQQNQSQRSSGGMGGGSIQQPSQGGGGGSFQPSGGGNFQPSGGGNFQPSGGGGGSFQPSGGGSGGGSQPPPPPPSSLVDTPIFGNVIRAFIRLSN